MGITGLLPFLEKSSKKTHISQFAGGTAVIDTYCWLHKGVFSCAEKVSMGQPTDAFIHYCMKFLNVLLSHKIKPILVFDGGHLPAKAETEVKRREARELNRHKAAELMQMGQHTEARNLLRRSIDITHEMALEVIKHCQQMNIDCIVAPYEADAQLAYLNISGIADIVITEDSDLLLFGCTKVFFKMDINGNGQLIDQAKLHIAMDVSPENFSMDDFRNMCILSGCDYLASLPGIGLAKARKFIKINTDCDIHRALTRLGSYLNMKSLVVTKEYRDAFILAIITFKHQLVFCPLKRQQVRLYPPTPDVTEEQLYHAGVERDPNIALQLAYGNCDPFTFKILHNFDPDEMQLQNRTMKSNMWVQKLTASHHSVSIWSKEYKINQNSLNKSVQEKNLLAWPNTVNNQAIIPTIRAKRPIVPNQENIIDTEQLNEKEILDTYESNGIMNSENNLELNISVFTENNSSPDLIRRANPFTRESIKNKTSPSLLTKGKSRTKGKNIMRIRRTVLNEETITESKFFTKSTTEMNNVIRDDDKMCLSTDALSQKENMEVENNTKTDTTDLKVLTDNSCIEKDSGPMDVDEKQSLLLISTKSKNNGLSTASSDRDLEKPKLYVSNSEPLANGPTVIESSLTLSQYNDFLIRHEDVDVLHNNVFKWSDTKGSTERNVKTKRNKNKTPLSSQFITNSKAKLTNSTRRNQQLLPGENRQSLLKMFGFEKKRKLDA